MNRHKLDCSACGARVVVDVSSRQLNVCRGCGKAFCTDCGFTCACEACLSTVPNEARERFTVGMLEAKREHERFKGVAYAVFFFPIVVGLVLMFVLPPLFPSAVRWYVSMWAFGIPFVVGIITCTVFGLLSSGHGDLMQKLAKHLFQEHPIPSVRAAMAREAALQELAAVKASARDPVEVVASHAKVARLMQACGDFEGALTHHQEALGFLASTCGPDHPGVATCFNEIGMLLQCQGRNEDAIGSYQRALEIFEASLGGDHLDVATILFNLACNFQDMARQDEALSRYQRALAIRERHLGSSDPLVVMVRDGIASLSPATPRHDGP